MSIGGNLQRDCHMSKHFVSRRTWLSALAGVAIPGLPNARAEVTDAVTDADLLEVLADEIEGGVISRDVRTTGLLAEWISRGGVDLPTWTDGADSLDHGHLETARLTDQFSLGARTLRRLAELNSFALPSDLPPRGPAILFGLRGCELLSTPGAFADTLQMREVAVDHLRPRCVIGLWRPSENQIAAFPASTVPNAPYMWVQVRLAVERTGDSRNACNLLPTGLHRFRVGVHNRRSRTTAVPGALVQASPAAVVRSFDDLKFTAADVVSEPRLVGDNLHPAFMVGRTAPPFFSSAGCQVIPGSFVNGRATGHWLKFAQLLGLVDGSGRPFITDGQSTERDGDAYVYMLLTGREARLVSNGQDSRLRRLRFGSSGPEARIIRERLGQLPAGSVLDGPAVWKFSEWHFDLSPARANVITPERASQLGVSL